MPDPEFSQRDRVLAHITRALLAGLLVQVGDKVLALREPGEVIDDGEHVVLITEGGRYQGIDSGVPLVTGKPRVAAGLSFITRVVRRDLFCGGSSIRYPMKRSSRSKVRSTPVA